MNRQLIITCEHAGNEVPEAYRFLFKGNEHQRILRTHRGIDIGAEELATTIGSVMRVQPHLHKVSRLLVDLNRSLHNPSVFSEYTERLDAPDRHAVIAHYYKPHRQRVREEISNYIAGGKSVIHLGVHTFTPRLEGVVRNTDVGFLYDPKRASEKEFCWQWRRSLYGKMPALRYRMNYPYRGTMDGFTTALKKEFPEERYWGIELEVNQQFPLAADEDPWKELQQAIAVSLKNVMRMEES